MPNPFRYYFPNAKKGDVSDGQKIHRQFLIDHKLGDSLNDLWIEPNDCHVFQVPNGGALLTPGLAEGRVANVAPDLGSLRRHQYQDPQGHEVWLMWENEPPEISDLSRRSRIDGYRIKIEGFKSEMTVPVARSHQAGGVTLPHSFVFDIESDGYQDYRSVIDGKFLFLWQMGQEYFDSMFGAKPALSEARQLEIAIKTIQVNYRIGKLELDVLQREGRGLLSSMNLTRILFLLVDAPNFPQDEEKPSDQMTEEEKSIEAQKKTSNT